MPRTRRSALPLSSAKSVVDRALEVSSATFASADSASDFAHSWFLPLHYEPGYAYPLIVWLHGHGDNEHQLRRVMPLVSMRNYMAVAPRGLNNVPDGSDQQYHWTQSDDHIQQAEQRVFDCIERAGRKCHVHARRVFLAGFDCGGTMALRIAMNHPGRFAGVISLCGAFPAGRTPFGQLAEVRRLGVFLASGRTSRQYPAAQVCEDLRLMHTAGLSITLRQYPCGHELMPQMLADVDRWIIERITQPRDAGGDSL